MRGTAVGCFMVGSVSGPAIGMLYHHYLYARCRISVAYSTIRTLHRRHHRHICSMAHYILVAIRNDPTRPRPVSSFCPKCPRKEPGLRQTLEALHCHKHVQSYAHLSSICLSQCLSCSKHYLPVPHRYLQSTSRAYRGTD